MASADAAALPTGRTLTRGLSSMLVGASAVPVEGTDLTGDSEPLRRQTTSQLNRTRVQENQRLLAQQLLMYSLPAMGCVAVVLAALFIVSFAIYVQGWMVMFNFSDKPCDQALKWWLLVMLLLPLVQCQLNRQTELDQRPKKLQALVTPMTIMVGAWMVYSCKTCQTTAPELYRYAKMYLIYQSVLWLSMLLASCGVVSAVLWAHRRGLLDSGPGPASAARPGLVDELESAPFDPSLFSGGGGNDAQPPECSICCEAFSDGDTIKRTPCGHYFCEECLGNWLENYAKTCPLCRTDLEQAKDASGSGSQA